MSWESKGLRERPQGTVFSASGHFDSLRLLIFCLHARVLLLRQAHNALSVLIICILTMMRPADVKILRARFFCCALQGSENRSLGINTLRPICLHNWDLLLIWVLKWRFSVTHTHCMLLGKLKCKCFVLRKDSFTDNEKCSECSVCNFFCCTLKRLSCSHSDYLIICFFDSVSIFLFLNSYHNQHINLVYVNKDCLNYAKIT